MNKVVMMGRLTKDPEIRFTTGETQTAVAKWSIAVDRRFSKGEQRQADFFDCTAFGKTAEHLEKYWKKGMKAAVTGRLENEAWTAKDGTKRTGTKILIDEIEFCERKDAAAQEEPKATDFVPAAEDEGLPFKF